MEIGLQGLFTSKEAICSSKEKYIYMLITKKEMRLKKHRIAADLLSKQARYLLCNGNKYGESVLLCFLVLLNVRGKV